MNPNVHERAESRDVGYQPRQPHTRFQVSNVLHAFVKSEGLELLAWVPSRAGQLRHDIPKGGQAHRVADIAIQIDA